MYVIEALTFHNFIGNNVMAYVGPGLGTGTLALVLGFLASIFLALFAVLWYPLKRLFKKMNKSKSETHANH